MQIYSIAHRNKFIELIIYNVFSPFKLYNFKGITLRLLKLFVVLMVEIKVRLCQMVYNIFGELVATAAQVDKLQR